jgi:formylglycine-generating enzyme required for sulfatase activity
MNEQTDRLELADTGGTLELRNQLEQMRRDAAEEIARLNRKLAEREYAMESTVASATERQAMQQELTTLRHSLGERGKTLDRITGECRRLEDELEDRHQEADALKNEVQRKETSLKAARDELQRLRHQMAELQEQSVDIAAVINQAQHPNLLSLPPVETDTPPRAVPQVISFSAGLLSGLAVIAVVAVFLWGGISLELPRFWERTPTSPIGEGTSVGEGASAEPVAVGAVPASERPEAEVTLIPAVSVGPPAEPPPILRDRLRGGSLGPTMAVLAGGTFRMGQNSMGGSDSGPEHEVRIPPFLIGVHEVTFQQYDGFARATGRPLPEAFGWGRGTRPVVAVSWSDAQAYADWLTRQTGQRYRLPSEAEWEFAARAGVRSSYPWGFSMERGKALCFDCGSQWDNRSTAPVGSFAPSAFGLYDTAGNVLEWVADCYTASYDGAPADGRARVDGGCTNRVARGGAFNKPASSMKTHVRAKFLPESRLNMLGFRVARDP